MVGKAVNGQPTKKTAEDFYRRWRAVEAECSSIIGTAMREAKTAKKELLDEIEGAGVKRNVFRKVMKEDALFTKADAVRGTIDDQEAVDQFDNLKLALGMLEDLPLGQAAIVEETKRRGRPKKDRAETFAEELGRQNRETDAKLRGETAGSA